jgi:5'-nucleotidase
MEDQNSFESYKRNLPSHSKKLEILHFNDVYNIEGNDEANEVVAGAARFVSALDKYGSKDKLVIFSGDLFFPSNFSTFFHGEQMLVPFNRMNVDISCLGNHEVDEGIEVAEKLIAQTSCPWVLSNMFETDKGNRPLAGVNPHHVLEHQGFKIGFVGFADEEWPATFMPDLNCDVIEYADYNAKLQEHSALLKQQEDCDLVFALNHMRRPDDENMMAQNTHEVVDVILGGHDHSYVRHLNQDTNIYLVKSGCDFETFSNLTILFGVEKQDADVYLESVAGTKDLQVDYSEATQRLYICEKVTITKRFEPDAEVHQHTQGYCEQVNKKLDIEACYADVELEGRFNRLRTQETNLGNWMADLVRSEFQTDFGLSNGGSMRANQVFSRGALTFRFLSSCLPMIDQIVRFKLTGQHLKNILENGLSAWPRYDGRFPLVSGFKFKFDGTQPAGSRILVESMTIENGEPILMDQWYTLATKYYISTGKDGYSAFKDPGLILMDRSHQDCPSVQSIVEKWFSSFSKSKEELQNLTKRGRQILDQRLKMFETSEDNRCPQGKFIKFSCKIEERIVNVGEPLSYEE